MNIGDYVRYKYEDIVYIGKIKFISEVMGFDETLQFEIDDCMEEILKKDIIKSSPQIIDLIEKGDYINGSWVNEIKDGKPYHEDYNDPFYSYYIENDDIKTIVTHEQMEAMQYRVEE